MNEIHFVYEAEDLCIGGILKDRLQAGLIVVEVAFQFAALHVKHVDEHFDVAKYALSLTGNIALHERLLPATGDKCTFTRCTSTFQAPAASSTHAHLNVELL